MTADDPTTETAAWTEYRQASATLSGLRWRSRFISARLLARLALDSLRFGTGVAERLAAALTLSAPFFLVFLLVGRLQHLDPDTVLLSAFISSLAGFSLLAILGTWGADDDLRARQDAIRPQLEVAQQWFTESRERWREADEDRRAREAAKKEREEVEAEARRSAEEKAAFEAERRRLTEKVDCPLCYAKIDRRASICKTCRRVVRRGVAPEVPSRPRRGLVPPLVAAMLSAVVPGLGHIARGRVLHGLIILILLFPLTIGCGVGIAATGFFTGGLGFVAAAIFVPLVYISIILDSASSE